MIILSRLKNNLWSKILTFAVIMTLLYSNSAWAFDNMEGRQAIKDKIAAVSSFQDHFREPGFRYAVEILESKIRECRVDDGILEVINKELERLGYKISIVSPVKWLERNGENGKPLPYLVFNFNGELHKVIFNLKIQGKERIEIDTEQGNLTLLKVPDTEGVWICAEPSGYMPMKTKQIFSHRFRRDIRKLLRKKLIEHKRELKLKIKDIDSILSKGLTFTSVGTVNYVDDRIFDFAAEAINEIRKGKNKPELNGDAVKAALEYHEQIHGLLKKNSEIFEKIKKELHTKTFLENQWTYAKIIAYFQYQYGVYPETDIIIEELIVNYYMERMLGNETLELLDEDSDTANVVTLEEMHTEIPNIIKKHMDKFISSIDVKKPKGTYTTLKQIQEYLGMTEDEMQKEKAEMKMWKELDSTRDENWRMQWDKVADKFGIGKRVLIKGVFKYLIIIENGDIEEIARRRIESMKHGSIESYLSMYQLRDLLRATRAVQDKKSIFGRYIKNCIVCLELAEQDRGEAEYFMTMAEEYLGRASEIIQKEWDMDGFIEVIKENLEKIKQSIEKSKDLSEAKETEEKEIMSTEELAQEKEKMNILKTVYAKKQEDLWGRIPWAKIASELNKDKDNLIREVIAYLLLIECGDGYAGARRLGLKPITFKFYLNKFGLFSFSIESKIHDSRGITVRYLKNCLVCLSLAEDDDVDAEYLISLTEEYLRLVKKKVQIEWGLDRYIKDIKERLEKIKQSIGKAEDSSVKEEKEEKAKSKEELEILSLIDQLRGILRDMEAKDKMLETCKDLPDLESRIDWIRKKAKEAGAILDDIIKTVITAGGGQEFTSLVDDAKKIVSNIHEILTKSELIYERKKEEFRPKGPNPEDLWELLNKNRDERGAVNFDSVAENQKINKMFLISIILIYLDQVENGDTDKIASRLGCPRYGLYNYLQDCITSATRTTSVINRLNEILRKLKTENKEILKRTETYIIQKRTLALGYKDKMAKAASFEELNSCFGSIKEIRDSAGNIINEVKRKLIGFEEFAPKIDNLEKYLREIENIINQAEVIAGKDYKLGPDFSLELEFLDIIAKNIEDIYSQIKESSSAEVILEAEKRLRMYRDKLNVSLEELKRLRTNIKEDKLIWEKKNLLEKIDGYIIALAGRRKKKKLEVDYPMDEKDIRNKILIKLEPRSLGAAIVNENLRLLKELKKIGIPILLVIRRLMDFGSYGNEDVREKAGELLDIFRRVYFSMEIEGGRKKYLEGFHYLNKEEIKNMGTFLSGRKGVEEMLKVPRRAEVDMFNREYPRLDKKKVEEIVNESRERKLPKEDVLEQLRVYHERIQREKEEEAERREAKREKARKPFRPILVGPHKKVKGRTIDGRVEIMRQFREYFKSLSDEEKEDLFAKVGEKIVVKVRAIYEKLKKDMPQLIFAEILDRISTKTGLREFVVCLIVMLYITRDERELDLVDEKMLNRLKDKLKCILWCVPIIPSFFIFYFLHLPVIWLAIPIFSAIIGVISIRIHELGHLKASGKEDPKESRFNPIKYLELKNSEDILGILFTGVLKGSMYVDLSNLELKEKERAVKKGPRKNLSLFAIFSFVWAAILAFEFYDVFSFLTFGADIGLIIFLIPACGIITNLSAYILNTWFNFKDSDRIKIKEIYWGVEAEKIKKKTLDFIFENAVCSDEDRNEIEGELNNFLNRLGEKTKWDINNLDILGQIIERFAKFKLKYSDRKCLVRALSNANIAYEQILSGLKLVEQNEDWSEIARRLITKPGGQENLLSNHISFFVSIYRVDKLEEKIRKILGHDFTIEIKSPEIFRYKNSVDLDEEERILKFIKLCKGDLGNFKKVLFSEEIDKERLATIDAESGVIIINPLNLEGDNRFSYELYKVIGGLIAEEKRLNPIGRVLYIYDKLNQLDDYKMLKGELFMFCEYYLYDFMKRELVIEKLSKDEKEELLLMYLIDSMRTIYGKHPEKLLGLISYILQGNTDDAEIWLYQSFVDFYGIEHGTIILLALRKASMEYVGLKKRFKKFLATYSGDISTPIRRISENHYGPILTTSPIWAKFPCKLKDLVDLESEIGRSAIRRVLLGIGRQAIDTYPELVWWGKEETNAPDKVKSPQQEIPIDGTRQLDSSA